MGKGGAAGAKVSVTQYYRSFSVGICTGEVDSLNSVFFNEKRGFIGPLVDNGNTFLKKEDLFGGIRREGGIRGWMAWRKGTNAQLLPNAIATRMGGTQETLPGYRGIACAHFYGNSNAERPGFYVGANQPVMPDIWFNVTRLFADWQPDLRTVRDADNVFKIAVSIAFDVSGSMADDGRLDTAKAALELVFDAISNAITAFGLDIDLQILRFNTDTNRRRRDSATVADIDELREFVQNSSASGTTAFEPMVTFVESFFTERLDPDFDRRLNFIITDGEPTDNVANAQATMADILDSSSGVFNSADGTAVESYGINIVLADTTETLKFDNTGGVVPVLQSDDVTALAETIQAAIFRGEGLDANPAHIVYETLTNTSWGLGTPVADIDDAAFIYAAETFKNENLGLSLMWVEQTTIEEFLQEILDHVEASLYTDPVTGLFVLKPIRGDYNIADLPLLDDSNSDTISVSRRTPGEAINELNVSWTNPNNEKEETVTIQDLGGIVAAGGQIIPDNRNYYGVRSRGLAFQLARRDMAAVSARIFTAEVISDRTAADFVTGGVFRLTSEEHNLTEEVVRIAKIDPGRVGSGAVKMSVTRDIFALAVPDYEDPEDEDLQDEGLDPEVMDDLAFFTLNYFFVQKFIPSGVSLGSDYPDAFPGLLAATDNADALEYILFGPDEDAAGNTSTDDLGVRTLCSAGRITVAFPMENLTTTTAFNALTVGEAPVLGGFALLGSSSLPEDELEMVLLSGFDGTTWTIQRGILDTVPREWPIDTPIRFFEEESSIADQVTRADTETISYKALMRTSLGTLLEEDAPEVTYTLNARGEMPYRPANVLFEGAPWDNVEASALTEVTVAWSNRNRITEDSQVLEWSAADVTPESGQTVTLEFFDVVDEVVYRTTTGITGTSYVIPIADFNGKAITEVRVFAERDGFRSFTAHSRRVVTASGYGRVYGVDYGGKF